MLQGNQGRQGAPSHFLHGSVMLYIVRQSAKGAKGAKVQSSINWLILINIDEYQLVLINYYHLILLCYIIINIHQTKKMLYKCYKNKPLKLKSGFLACSKPPEIRALSQQPPTRRSQ